MCGLWGEMAGCAGCWDRSIPAFCGRVRAQLYQLAPSKLSPAFLDLPGPLFFPYSCWEERFWSASPSEISEILAGALTPHHHPSNQTLVAPTSSHVFCHHTLEDAGPWSGLAHTPILAQPPSLCSEDWLALVLTPGGHHDDW